MKSREYEVFTVVPMKELPNGVKFAPIGLIKMFNSGGSVKEFSYGSNGTFLLIYKSITFRLVIAI
jgi:raffinose synthase